VLSNACGAAAPRNSTATFVAACGAPAPASPSVIYASEVPPTPHLTVSQSQMHVLSHPPCLALQPTFLTPLLRTHTLSLSSLSLPAHLYHHTHGHVQTVSSASLTLATAAQSLAFKRRFVDICGPLVLHGGGDGGLGRFG